MKAVLAQLLVALLLVGSTATAAARTRLLTLPAPGRITLDLQQPATALVSEQRQMALTAGRNQVDFSWTDSRIDPASLLLQLLPTPAGDAPSGVKVVAINYPPGGKIVSWTLSADHAQRIGLRISYHLSGLRHQFHYRAQTGSDEQHLSLTQFLRLDNQTPDDFRAARISTPMTPPLVRSVPRATTLDLPAVRYQRVTLSRLYRADPLANGYLDRSQDTLNVDQHWVLINDQRHGLGQGALAPGKVRIFQSNGQSASAFLGEDRINATPPGERLTLTLGRARDIMVKRQVVRQQRQRIVGNLFRYTVLIRYRINNYRQHAARLALIEHPRQLRDQLFGHDPRPPQWRIGERTTLPQPPDPALSNQQQLVFNLNLPPQDGTGSHAQIYTLQLDFANEW